MDEKKIFMGLGGVAVLLFLIALIVPRDAEPETDISDLIAQELAPVTEQVAALSGRIEGVESSLGEITGQLAEAVSADDLSAVREQVEEAFAQTGSLSESLSALEGALEETAAAVQAAPPAAPVAADTTATTTAETPAAEAADGFTPGETALFADGQLRLFVSRLDAEAGAVLVSVAGEMKTLNVGEGRTMAAGDDFCRITVASIGDGGAEIDGICGDDLPAPGGIPVGETALFADGALRVFASRVTEDAARLAVNGKMHTLAVGRSAPATVGDEMCRVYVDAVDRGHVEVSSLCGAEVPVSDVAGPGSTVVLGDGAARVFVASVMDGSVRFAINGQTTVTGAPGDDAALEDGCAVTVEDVADGKASFSYACAE